MAVSSILRLANISKAKLWVDYDKEADVLYINFGKPQEADDSFLGEDDIIQRKRDGRLIGVTMLNASRFAN